MQDPPVADGVRDNAQNSGIPVPRAQRSPEPIKSISFSSSASFVRPGRPSSYGASPGAKRGSPMTSPLVGPPRRPIAEDGDAGESSADETTAIMKKPRETYGGTEPGTRDGAVDETEARGRRKSSQFQKTKGTKSTQQPNGRPEGQNGEDKQEKETWWKSFVDKYGSVELENKGSVARDHLALERTFLAWLRTSLSFASIGVAVTQLFRLNSSLSGGSRNGSTSDSSSTRFAEEDSTYEATHRLRQVGKPLGATFLGISILILLLGFHRYFESQHYVVRGKFPASRGSILLVTFVAAALIIASLVIVVTIAPSAFTQ